MNGTDPTRPTPDPLNPYAHFAPGGALSGMEEADPLNPYAHFKPQAKPPAAPAAAAQPEGPPGLMEEVGRGFQRGVRSVGADVLGAKALGKELLGFGAEEDVEAYRRANEEIQQNYAATVGRVEEIDNAYEFAQWVAGLIGEQSVMIAGAMMSGGLGSVLGKAVGRRVISKQLAEKALETATRKWGMRGALTGAAGFTSMVEGGGQYGEQIEAGVERQPLATVAGGLAAGGLEVITPALIAARFGMAMAPELAKKLTAHVASRLKGASLPVRMAANAVLIGSTEAGTELGQELVALAVRDFADENYEALGPEGRSRLLNAAAGGFVMGGGIGALTPPTRESAERGEREIEGYKPPPPPPPPIEQWLGKRGLEPLPSAVGPVDIEALPPDQVRDAEQMGPPRVAPAEPEPAMSPSQLVAYQQEVERARQVEGYFDPQYFEEIKGFTVPWKVVKDGEVSEVGVNAGEMYKKVQESLNWVAKMMQCMGGK